MISQGLKDLVNEYCLLLGKLYANSYFHLIQYL